MNSCCSKTLSPWLDLDIRQSMLQHLAKCFVCTACSSFLSSQTSSLGCADPFLFSHVWMPAHISYAMWFQPIIPKLLVVVTLELRSVSWCAPTQLSFSTWGSELASRCTKLQANSQAIWSTKAFSLEQRLKLGTLMTTERNSPRVRWELKLGLCVWVWYPTQKTFDLVWVTGSKSLPPSMWVRSAGFWTRTTASRPHQDDGLCH